MPKGKPFPPEFRVEVVRLHRMSGRALRETATEIGVASDTLARWVRQAEIDEGKAAGLTTEELQLHIYLICLYEASRSTFKRRLSE